MGHHPGEAGAQQAGRLGHGVLVEAGSGVVQVRIGRYDAVLPPLRLPRLQRGGSPPRRHGEVEAAAAPGERVMGQHGEARAGPPRWPGPVRRSGRPGPPPRRGGTAGSSTSRSAPPNLFPPWQCSARTPGSGPELPAGRTSQPVVRGPKPNCQLSWEVVTPSYVSSQWTVTSGRATAAGTPRASARSCAAGGGCLVAGLVPDIGRPVLIAGDRAGPRGLVWCSHWPACVRSGWSASLQVSPGSG